MRTAPIGPDVPGHLAWIVPGWVHDLRLTDLPPLQFPWSTVKPWGAAAAVRALARLAPTLLELLAPQPVPVDVPRLLLPALFLSGAWALEPGHMAALAGSWEEMHLASQAGRLPPELRRTLATQMWEFASKTIIAEGPAPVAERLAFLRQRHHPLLRFVVDNLPVDVISATARDAGTHRRYGQGGSFATTDPEALRELGPGSRTAAVRGWLEVTRPRPLRFDEARELVQVLDADDLELVLDVVRTADREVSAEFAGPVWRTIPERALEEARTAYEQGLASAEGWFQLAPRNQIGPLIDVVRASSHAAAWVPAWALRRLLDAGLYAEDLFRLSQSAR